MNREVRSEGSGTAKAGTEEHEPDMRLVGKDKVPQLTDVRTLQRETARQVDPAGVDGIRIDDLKLYLQEHWDRLKEELATGTYQPQAVLGVKIPKRSGGERLLGIPTTFDRMIQQAIHQELSPLFDPEFSEHSYGFRPGKSAAQAIQQALANINQGYWYIVDIDLKSFFDEVNHDYLMNLIKRKVRDPLVLRLIWKFLRSPVRVDGKLQKRRKGVPQGGPNAPGSTQGETPDHPVYRKPAPLTGERKEKRDPPATPIRVSGICV